MSIKDVLRAELLGQLGKQEVSLRGDLIEIDARCVDCLSYWEIHLNDLAAALKPIFEEFYDAGLDWQADFDMGSGSRIDEPNFDELWEQNR